MSIVPTMLMDSSFEAIIDSIGIEDANTTRQSYYLLYSS